MNQYLSAFKDNYCSLREEGIYFEGQRITVALKGMCCDSPAASFVKNIKSHNANFGCRKCTTKGVWVSNRITHLNQAKSGGRVTFSQISAPLRTNESFRNRSQVQHHNNDGRRSVAEDFLDDIVNDDIIDYMHLVCIGVHKKVINEWIFASFDQCRFKKEDVVSISTYLVGIGEYIPNLFPRKTRTLCDLKNWKATELRMDLLYICPVAYKKFLSLQRYDHLILLHVSIKLLVNKENCKTFADYADQLLRQYVTSFSSLYGPETITMNVHNLIYLANDVRRHGCLDDISAFPFENKLQKLTNLIRKSGKPLQQAVKRLAELERANISETRQVRNSEIVVDRPHSKGPLLFPHTRGQQYQTLSYKNTFLSTSKAENCVFLNVSNDVFLIENFVKLEENVSVVGRIYNKKEDMYTAVIQN